MGRRCYTHHPSSPLFFNLFIKEKSQISSVPWRRSCILLPLGTGLCIPGKQSQCLPAGEGHLSTLAGWDLQSSRSSSLAGITGKPQTAPRVAVWDATPRCLTPCHQGWAALPGCKVQPHARLQSPPLLLELFAEYGTAVWYCHNGNVLPWHSLHSKIPLLLCTDERSPGETHPSASCCC